MKRPSLYPFYLGQVLRSLAFSLFGIFIPIYLLTLGFALKEVLIYYLTFHIITIILVPISLKLSKHFGYKKIIFSSSLSVIIYLLLLQYIEVFNIPLFAIALFSAIESTFFCIPFHSYFTRLSEKAKRGTQVSSHASLGQFGGLIAPILGALIATFLGFRVLFSISILLVITSFIPLTKLQDIKPKTKFSIKSTWALAKKQKKYFFGEIVDTIKGETEAIIWPIFIFLTLKEFISVGDVAFLIGAGSILFTLFVGRHFDKKSRYFLMKLGGILYAAVWLLRIFIEAPFFLYTVSLAAGFFAIMLTIPFNAIFYDKAEDDKDTDEFVMVREIPTFIGRALLWIVLILVADKFTIAFIMAAIASLFFTFFRFDSPRKKN